MARVGDAVGFRRDGGRAAGADLARRGAIQAYDPDIFRRARGDERGVGVFARAVGPGTTHVDDRGGVGRPARFQQVLTIVFRIVRDLAALVGGWFGHHQVADALGIRNPRHLAPGGRGGQIGRERGTQNLVKRERRRLSPRTKRHRKNGEDSHLLDDREKLAVSRLNERHKL